MKVIILSEYGEKEAAFGIGLSYGKTSSKTFQEYVFHENSEEQWKVMEKLAGKGNGHDKFLRMMPVFLDIEAPMYWWKEFDTYKVATVAQSESTMHTITKKPLNQDNFENPISDSVLKELNMCIQYYKDCKKDGNETAAKAYWYKLINDLPMGFLQRRIVMCNYAVLQNIIRQRKGHKLKEWEYFIDRIKGQIAFPEFLKSSPEPEEKPEEIKIPGKKIYEDDKITIHLVQEDE